MAKTRVHELAKKYGIESKDVLEKLKEMGEFVKSPSSTIELPVEMKFKKAYGDALLASQAAAPAPAVEKPADQPAAKPAAKKAAAAPAATDRGPRGPRDRRDRRTYGSQARSAAPRGRTRDS